MAFVYLILVLEPATEAARLVAALRREDRRLLYLGKTTQVRVATLKKEERRLWEEQHQKTLSHQLVHITGPVTFIGEVLRFMFQDVLQVKKTFGHSQPGINLKMLLPAEMLGILSEAIYACGCHLNTFISPTRFVTTVERQRSEEAYLQVVLKTEEDEANLFSALQLHISTRRSGHIRRPEYLRHPLSLNILGSPRETLLKLYTHVFSGVADIDQAEALQRLVPS